MKLCGYKNGEIGRNHFQDSHNEKAEKLTLDEIAKELNISKSNLTRALSIERNLPPAQRLAVVDKFKKKIKEQAAIKANESRSKFHGNQHVEVCSPNGDHTKIKTDKELAKMAGVGTGTVARFNKVMNSDDEELKKKVLTNEISINAGYEKSDDRI